MIRAALATYYVALTATRLQGPFGLAEQWRHRVYRWRGLVVGGRGEWVDPTRASTTMPGTARTITDDWLASGVSCPVCASAYVAPLILALGRTQRGRRIVTALAVAGLASAIYHHSSD